MIVCPWKDINRYADVIPGLAEAVALVNSLESKEVATYPLSNEGKVMVQQGTTRCAAETDSEAHRRFLDVQYILEGEEYVGWAPVDTLTPTGDFNTEKDAGKYTGHCDYMHIAAGYCYVAFPEDAHKPACHLDTPTQYRKLVIKLKV